MSSAWPGQQPPPGGASREPNSAPAPGISTTVVITVLFGLFGLIPAAIAAGKARRTGYPENRYWIAFGVSMAASVALYAVVVFAGLALLFGAANSVDEGVTATANSTAGGSPTPRATASPPTSADAADGSCTFAPANSPGNTNLTEAGSPPAEVSTTGTTELRMETNVGPIELILDHSRASCAATSFVYLAQQDFFGGTVCHRETDSASLKVLQCGDPSGTESGGPTYEYPTQVTGAETYPRGTVAMASAGQGFDGSQFFLVWGDSQLPPLYTVVGTIGEDGLATLDTIAANGNDGRNGPGDGAPVPPIEITTLSPQS